MKLFEIADQGPLGSLLKVLKDKADKQGQTLVLSFDALRKMVDSDDYGISSPDALIQWKNDFDPNGKIIKDIDTTTGKIYIATAKQADNPNQPNTQQRMPGSVDKAATRALPPELKP